ncbi:ribosome-associated translation inhibitor RaiA [Aquiluna borgnonia]|jgi:ribosomal subunit interface protein|uniref:Ribosome hibernation promoting factor n=1 Tax=Aquiluna borgnonia TaxID=2499157 RepID=A0A7D4Q3L5_9MICO|nr:ribosome-associated translation inhibitor RaiA [Aquiluna borgnonia]QKJ24889.1 ribosome-associated translation inhibitor RaiA [Aquiluna borgnonia]
MELKITAKNLNVSDRFRDYVSEKAGKVEHYSHRPQELNIKVTRHDHSKHAGVEDQVEITVYEPGHVVRAEARASDKFAAFDIAFGKLVERLRRYADKHKVHRGGGHKNPSAQELAATDFASLDIRPADHDLITGANLEAEAQESVDYGLSPVVIKSKEFAKTPMTKDEAIGHMELVGHDFYLFHDSESDKPAVVYRRKGWSYGVISLV